MKILEIKIDNLSLEEVLEKIKAFLNDNKQRYITTSNPEFIIKAQKDEEFKKILNEADLNIPDGIGLILASFLFKKRLKERITGVDLMKIICSKAPENNWPIFLFGAGPGVAKKAAVKLREKHKRLEIDGSSRSDFFKRFALKKSDASQKNLNSDLLRKSPLILFVALGSLKQEKWIKNNLKRMPNVKLAIGVGGAFDFISGRVKRAPEFMRKIGLEWLWRLIIQPWRIKRIFNSVFIFPYLIIKDRIIHNLF